MLTTKIKAFLSLSKPGIIMGNLMTALCGFFINTNTIFSFINFFFLILGLSLVIASASVFNNIMDEKIDKLMERTKKRALSLGLINLGQAKLFGCMLIITGLFILTLQIDILTAALAFLGFILYLFFYTPSKYKTFHSTLVGSLSGAIPPLVGYSARNHSLDSEAWVLFLIVLLWQMPHFYAIAIYRKEEYQKASLPLLPLIKGNQTTKVHMVIYLLFFSIIELFLIGNLSSYFVILLTIFNIVWLIQTLKGFKMIKNDQLWARKNFFLSLFAITFLSISIITEALST